MKPGKKVETFWNGEPCKAMVVRVVVGKPPKMSWWSAHLVGTIRLAVRVEYAGQTFYLENDDGSGWRKVTKGQGSPTCGHKSLPVEKDLGPV